MIELSAAAASVLAQGIQVRRLRVESWRGDQLLDDDVPVSAGIEEVDRTLAVPERVTLTVPRTDRGTDYTPNGEDHPLAARGQRLRISVGVGTTYGEIEWLCRGWFVITESTASGNRVDVDAAGLLYLVQEARLVSPFQPSGTFTSTIRGLVEPALTVDFDAALTDRAVPASINVTDDRLGALLELLTAWPADAYVTPDGYLSLVPATDAAAVSLALTDGAGGTVIQVTGASSRDGAYNAVVARGTADDGSAVQGVAYDLTGPARVGGPFSPLPVPLYLDSPLITTQTQAQAAADTRLATIRRSTSQNYAVDMVPHPALQAGDRVTLTTDVLAAQPAIIEHSRLPLLAGGGQQTLTVRTVT